MNIETLIVIACLVLVLGGGAIFSLRRGRRNIANSPDNAIGNKKVTGFGFAYAVVFVSLIIGAFSLKYIVPGMSELVRQSLIALVLVIGVIGEKLALKLGYKIIGEGHDEK